jgi:prepilin-type N-terminal cleavage/methylation domain-containing protein
MKKHGMTLLEVMIALAIFTIVSGVVFVLASTLGQATSAQEAKVTSLDGVRAGMTILVNELHHASFPSVAGQPLPNDSLVYTVPQDLDGNGVPVDVGGHAELSLPRTIIRDWDDANADGFSDTQLILNDNGAIRVIANGVVPNEDANDDGLLDASEDLNGNGVLDRGVWFEPWGNSVRVTLQVAQSSGPRGQNYMSTLVEVITPRN